MNSSPKEINICAFVNPYLFWMTYSGFKEEAEIRHLEKKLEGIYQHWLPGKETFIVCEQVVVKHGKIWARAIIVDIEVDDNTEIYFCWLNDYGLMIKSTLVFKYRLNYYNPDMAKQVCLNNTVFLKEKLNFDNDFTELVRVARPTSATEKKIFEIISGRKKLFFVKENECDDILFGDILYIENKEMKSLREMLIKNKFAVLDEEYFTAVANPSVLKNKSLFLREIYQSYVGSKYSQEVNSEKENYTRSFKTSNRGISLSKKRSPKQSNSEKFMSPTDMAFLAKVENNKSHNSSKMERHSKIESIETRKLEIVTSSANNSMCNISQDETISDICQSQEPVVQESHQKETLHQLLGKKNLLRESRDKSDLNMSSGTENDDNHSCKTTKAILLRILRKKQDHYSKASKMEDNSLSKSNSSLETCDLFSSKENLVNSVEESSNVSTKRSDGM